MGNLKGKFPVFPSSVGKVEDKEDKLDMYLNEQRSSLTHMMEGKKPRSQHDRVRLVEAMAKVLVAYGYAVKGCINSGQIKLVGDSGTAYYPDILAQKGPWTILGEARTRGQSGTSDMLDRRSVQSMVAVIADLQKMLKRPHGMLISPHGIHTTAQKVAEHFGIIVAIVPYPFVDKILDMDPQVDRDFIMDAAKKIHLVY